MSYEQDNSALGLPCEELATEWRKFVTPDMWRLSAEFARRNTEDLQNSREELLTGWEELGLEDFQTVHAWASLAPASVVMRWLNARQSGDWEESLATERAADYAHGQLCSQIALLRPWIGADAPFLNADSSFANLDWQGLFDRIARSLTFFNIEPLEPDSSSPEMPSHLESVHFVVLDDAVDLLVGSVEDATDDLDDSFDGDNAAFELFATNMGAYLLQMCMGHLPEERVDHILLEVSRYKWKGQQEQ